jgi:hypothetical protein
VQLLLNKFPNISLFFYAAAKQGLVALDGNADQILGVKKIILEHIEAKIHVCDLNCFTYLFFIIQPACILKIGDTLMVFSCPVLCFLIHTLAMSL